MKKTILITVSLVSVLLLSAICCKKSTGSPKFSGASFYYWKTKLKFNKTDRALADSLGMKRLYLRYFDVDWSPSLEMPVPVGALEIDDVYETGLALKLAGIQVIPTVYIVNRVFEKNYNADSLAQKISKRLREDTETISYQLYDYGYDYEHAEDPPDWSLPDSLSPPAIFRSGIKEIQLDCDWTASTRDRYFDFVKAMKSANPGLQISCTVRLHQFRDRAKAGIPPVEKGTLMCYNMAPPKDIKTRDAIYDAELAEGYLRAGEYPLQLEAALPLFSWGALFHENQFKGLASGLTEAEVKGNPLFAPESEGRYRFTQDTVFSDVYMREGDIVRLDGPSPNEIQSLAERLGEIKAVKSISFFDWNPSKIREYHVEEICKNH